MDDSGSAAGALILYRLRLRREFTVTCGISPREVQAEDVIKKFQKLYGHHISSIYKAFCDVNSTFLSSAIVSSCVFLSTFCVFTSIV